MTTPDTTPAMQDWHDEGENGRYSCRCVQCGKEFIGHKRRTTCPLCAVDTTPELHAITVRQPWAWAIIYAGKDIENRTWDAPHYLHGSRILIHAAKGMTRREYDEGRRWMYNERVVSPMSVPAYASLARGCFVGSVLLERVVYQSRSRWFTGPVGWVLRGPLAMEPREWKGTLGFFKVPFDAGALA